MVTILEVEHACKKVLFSFFKYLFIYLPVLRLSCGMWDLVRAQTRARLGSPALGLQSLSHWTTREVPLPFFFFKLHLRESSLLPTPHPALCSTWDLSSLTRDGTHAPLQWKLRVLITGQSGRSLECPPSLPYSVRTIKI